MGEKGEYTRSGFFSILAEKGSKSYDAFRELCRKPTTADYEGTQLYEERISNSPDGFPRYILTII